MTSNGNANQPTSWEVTSQYEDTDVSVPGRLTQGYRVTFRTGQGHTGTVFIPLAQYRPDAVRAAVASQAALLDAVGNLSSGG